MVAIRLKRLRRVTRGGIKPILLFSRRFSRDMRLTVGIPLLDPRFSLLLLQPALWPGTGGPKTPLYL